MKIYKSIIGENFKPYIIAEACINHQGNMKIAKKMIEIAANCGVSAVKFQFHILDDEMLRNTPKSKNFKKTLYETLDNTNFNIKEHLELKNLCEKNKIDYLCTPFSIKSADILEKDIKVKVFKTGSGELTNIPFQIHIAKKRIPTIISTGMSEMNEIAYKINKLKNIIIIYALPSVPLRILVRLAFQILVLLKHLKINLNYQWDCLIILTITILHLEQ
jgi:N-acetylneuraminate synthase